MANAAVLSVGYDVEFVDEHVSNESLECSICLLVLRKPMQAVPCGHRFCMECIGLVEEEEGTENVSCPIDRATIQVFPDVGKEREMLEFKVKCQNSGTSKCQWTGALRSYEEHLNKCQFHIMECEKKCGQKDILRKEMAQHLEDSCPNNCIYCPYSLLGCQFKGKGEQLESHMKDSLVNHLHSQVADQNTRLSHLEENLLSEKNENEKLKKQLFTSSTKITQLENNLTELKIELLAHQQEQIREISILQAKTQSLSMFYHPKCPFAFTIKNVSLEMKKPGNPEYESQTFEFLNGYRGRLRVIFNNDYVSEKKESNAVAKKFRSGRFQKIEKCDGELTSLLLEKFLSVYLAIARGPFDDVLEWPMLFGEVSYKCFTNGECIAAAKLKCKDSAKALKETFDKPGLEPVDKRPGWGIPKFINQSNIPDFISGDEIKFVIDIK